LSIDCSTHAHFVERLRCKHPFAKHVMGLGCPLPGGRFKRMLIALAIMIRDAGDLMSIQSRARRGFDTKYNPWGVVVPSPKGIRMIRFTGCERQSTNRLLTVIPRRVKPISLRWLSPQHVFGRYSTLGFDHLDFPRFPQSRRLENFAHCYHLRSVGGCIGIKR
jgi:hypothetical protein